MPDYVNTGAPALWFTFHLCNLTPAVALIAHLFEGAVLLPQSMECLSVLASCHYLHLAVQL